MDIISYELMAYGLAIGLVAGALAGTLAGLAGLGGGLVYVPVLYLTMPGDQQHISLHIFGSLVAIVMTGFFSARAHWRLGHLHMTSLKKLFPGLMLGASFGLWSTLQISEVFILLTLAILNLWVAWDYGREVLKADHAPLIIMSGPIGYLSGVLGIGGGTLLVPLLRRIIPLRQAVGTSAMCGMLMALIAVVINLMLEPVWVNLLSGQFSFLSGVWLGIILIIPKTSGWLAYLHTTVEETVMKRLLKILFSGISISLFIAALYL